MVQLTIQYSDHDVHSYNFRSLARAIMFLLDVNSRQSDPTLLSDVGDPYLLEWLLDFIPSDNNRVLEYSNPNLIGRIHAENTQSMFDRIGRCVAR